MGRLLSGGANNNTKTFYTPGDGATLTMGSILLAPPGGRVDHGGAREIREREERKAFVKWKEKKQIAGWG